eukprot:GSChrysophyteH2.ASY1.ANO1.519.1 assembled CDS
MHGRVRGRDADKSEAERVAAQETLKRKAGMYLDLTTMVTKLRSAGDLSEKSLGLTSKLLRINPDYYSQWNYRREILIGLHGDSLGLGAAATPDDELQLSKEAIMKNPKAYGAWWHRCWIMQRFDVDYNSELKLCGEFLNQDQRNFHCWNYRRYVVQTGCIPATDEFQYSTEKIEQNFSNYSAFHHRSVFITQLEHKSIENMKAAMQVEFAIIENATFTDPYDQSAWWYHRFILHFMKRQVLENSDGSESDMKEWCVDILQHQIDNITSLIEFEPTCKWPVDSLVYLLTLLQEVQGQQTPEHQQRIHNLLGTLKELDPIRSRRYEESQQEVKWTANDDVAA